MKKVIFRIEKDPFAPNVFKYLAVFPNEEAPLGRVCVVPFYKNGDEWRFDSEMEVTYNYMKKCQIIYKKDPIVPTLVQALKEKFGGTYFVSDKII